MAANSRAVRSAWALVAAAALAAGCGSSGHRAGPAAVASPPTSSTPPAPPSALVATTEPWTLPAAVSRPVVLPAVDGSGDFVVLGGLATGDTSTDRIVQVDPGTGAAQLAGRLALAVHDSAGADIGGRYELFAGGSYSTVSGVQAWAPGGGATTVGHLPAPRSDLSAASSGSVTYIAGGFDGQTMDPEVLATSDGTTFRTVGSLAVPVRYAAIGLVGSDLWVIGGVTSTAEGGTTETDAIQRLDLGTGQSAVVGHLPQPLGHAGAVVLDGALWVLGGRSGTVPSSAILRLDPATGTVRPAGTLPQAVSDAGAVVIGDDAFLVGGEVTGPTQPLATVVELRPQV